MKNEKNSILQVSKKSLFLCSLKETFFKSVDNISNRYTIKERRSRMDK